MELPLQYGFAPTWWAQALQTMLPKDSGTPKVEPFLYDAIGPHGTSEFCDRVLDGGLGEADREDINHVEAYELLKHIQRKKQVGEEHRENG